MFVGAFPALDAAERHEARQPASRRSSRAVIFNALIIVALIPLALRGVKFPAAAAAAMLRRNLLIYGVGGLIAPFVGIKLIDLDRPRSESTDDSPPARSPAPSSSSS